MSILKTEITETEKKEIDFWRRKLSKTKRQMVREALSDYFTRQRNIELGLDLVWVQFNARKKG